MSTDAGPGTLAEKLNELFRTVHPPDRGAYSNEEVAAEIRRGGESMSATYLWLLRRGERANPTMRHLQALAGFFGVSPAYFFSTCDAHPDGAGRNGAHAAGAGPDGAGGPAALRRTLAGIGLSEASQRLVEHLVEHCLRMERVPDVRSD